MPRDLVVRHQRRFDRQFPDGAIATWLKPGTGHGQTGDIAGEVTYLIPRITVTGQAGLDPEIQLPVFAGSDKVLGPLRVLAMTDEQRKPYAALLQIDGEDRPLLLSAGVTEEAARAMAADRQMFIDRAPDGGTGQEPE